MCLIAFNWLHCILVHTFTCRNLFEKGGVLDVFYPDWKMRIAANERLFNMTRQLWREAYCHSAEELGDLAPASDRPGSCSAVDDAGDDSFKWHPFGAFDCDRGYMVSLVVFGLVRGCARCNCNVNDLQSAKRLVAD